MHDTSAIRRTRSPLPASARPGASGPVQRLSLDEARAAAATLKASLLDGWQPSEDGLPAHATQEQQAWDTKLDDSRDMLDALHRTTADLAIGCFFEGEPIGLMTLIDPVTRLGQAGTQGLKVDHLVTHPGSAGAGGAMVEEAVKLSQQRGYGGKLHLFPLDGAVPAYEALGFTHHPDGLRMTLNPGEAGTTWAKRDGEWRLRKYLGKELASSMAGVSTARDA